MRIEQSSPPARAARSQVDRPATMRDPSRSPIDVVLRNLSETGALLEGDETLPVGTLVSLGIAGAGIHFGRIARLTPSGMATEFMVPLDPAAVARAKAAETLVSVAFPQIPVHRQPAAQSLRSSAELIADARSSRTDVDAAFPPWAGWIVVGVIVAVLAFLLL